MAQTYSIDTKGYITNDYLTKKLIEDKILVTTRYGGWAVLSNEEFELLRRRNVESNIPLYNILAQEGIISTEDNLPLIAKQCRQKYQQLSDATTLHIVTPTLRCNHKCIYCYAASKPLNAMEYDMNEETAKAVVDFIFQCPSKGITIEFQGGEPLLNFPIIQYIVNYAGELNKEKKKNINFRLVTNLTLMDEEKLNWLIENKVNLNSSLDGPKEVHNKNRFYENGKGSYDEVIEGIKKLKEKGVSISLMPTITRFSLPYLREIIDEYRKLGQNSFWARRLNVGGFAVEKWKKIGYTAEEYLDFWKNCVEYIFELNKKGIKMQEGYVGIILRNILFSKKYNSFVCLASPCGCAWSQASYNYKGDIYACDEARSFDVFKLGNVKETTYKELYSSWNVLDIVDLTSGNSFDCSECVYHPFCGPCIVDEYGEHGNIIKKPDSFNCKVKKGMLDYIFKEIILNNERFEIAKEWVGIRGKDADVQNPENTA